LNNLVNAYLIHAKSYRDTSLLIDFFTKEYGFITAVAKGIRTQSKNNKRGLLQPFGKLLINWRGKSDLVTLNTVELANQPYVFKKNQLAFGFYINELIYYLCSNPKGIIYTGVFEIYENILSKINADYHEKDIREFELELLSCLGYGLLFDNIDAKHYYGYDFTNGFFILNSSEQIQNKLNPLSLRGNLIINIMHRDWQDQETLIAAKKLLRSIIKYYIGDKELHSRKLFV